MKTKLKIDDGDGPLDKIWSYVLGDEESVYYDDESSIISNSTYGTNYSEYQHDDVPPTRIRSRNGHNRETARASRDRSIQNKKDVMRVKRNRRKEKASSQKKVVASDSNLSEEEMQGSGITKKEIKDKTKRKNTSRAHTFSKNEILKQSLDRVEEDDDERDEPDDSVLDMASSSVTDRDEGSLYSDREGGSLYSDTLYSLRSQSVFEDNGGGGFLSRYVCMKNDGDDDVLGNSDSESGVSGDKTRLKHKQEKKLKEVFGNWPNEILSMNLSSTSEISSKVLLANETESGRIEDGVENDLALRTDKDNQTSKNDSQNDTNMTETTSDPMNVPSLDSYDVSTTKSSESLEDEKSESSYDYDTADLDTSSRKASSRTSYGTANNKNKTAHKTPRDNAGVSSQQPAEAELVTNSSAESTHDISSRSEIPVEGQIKPAGVFTVSPKRKNKSDFESAEAGYLLQIEALKRELECERNLRTSDNASAQQKEIELKGELETAVVESKEIKAILNELQKETDSKILSLEEKKQDTSQKLHKAQQKEDSLSQQLKLVKDYVKKLERQNDEYETNKQNQIGLTQELEHLLQKANNEMQIMRRHHSVCKKEAESIRLFVKAHNDSVTGNSTKKKMNEMDNTSTTSISTTSSASNSLQECLIGIKSETRLLLDSRRRVMMEAEAYTDKTSKILMESESNKQRFNDMKKERTRAIEKMNQLAVAVEFERSRKAEAIERANKAEQLLDEASRTLIRDKDGAGSSDKASALSAELVEARKSNERLKESFKEQIGLFREGVYLMTGFEIGMLPDTERPTFKLRSMYAENDGDHLLLKWPEDNNSEVTSLDIVETDFVKTLLGTDSYDYLTKFDSLPSFLASVQLGLFEKSNLRHNFFDMQHLGGYSLRG